MNRLFIEVYLDEYLDILVAELLRYYGYVAITARDPGQLQKSDEEQLQYAVSEGKALLKHNRIDFEQLAREYFLSGQNHYGIIFAVRRSPQEIVRRLLVILERVTADEMENQVRYI